jgi:hypothetical protein
VTSNVGGHAKCLQADVSDMDEEFRAPDAEVVRPEQAG